MGVGVSVVNSHGPHCSVPGTFPWVHHFALYTLFWYTTHMPSVYTDVAFHAGQDAAVVARSLVAAGWGPLSPAPQPLKSPATSTLARADK